MSRSSAIAAVAAMAAGFAPLPLESAVAQGVVSTEDAITVTAPHRRTTGRSAIGAPIEIMEAQSIVYYGDLNLTTAAGRDELRKRVATAAESSCKWLDEVFRPDPATSTTNAECRREAIARAEPQIKAVLGSGG